MKLFYSKESKKVKGVWIIKFYNWIDHEYQKIGTLYVESSAEYSSASERIEEKRRERGVKKKIWKFNWEA